MENNHTTITFSCYCKVLEYLYVLLQKGEVHRGEPSDKHHTSAQTEHITNFSTIVFLAEDSEVSFFVDYIHGTTR